MGTAGETRQGGPHLTSPEPVSGRSIDDLVEVQQYHLNPFTTVPNVVRSLSLPSVERPIRPGPFAPYLGHHDPFPILFLFSTTSPRAGHSSPFSEKEARDRSLSLSLSLKWTIFTHTHRHTHTHTHGSSSTQESPSPGKAKRVPIQWDEHSLSLHTSHANTNQLRKYNIPKASKPELRVYQEDNNTSLPTIISQLAPCSEQESWRPSSL